MPTDLNLCLNERDADNKLIVRNIRTNEITARLTDEEAAALFTERVTA